LDIASASADVSDGLIADLEHICAVSNLSAVVEAATVPLSPPVTVAVRRAPEHLATALTGGDDYEVVFTAPPTATARINELSHSLGIPITPMGRMTAPSRLESGRVLVLGKRGELLRFK
jgi:thiamine-monophosphate kinase